MHTILLNSIIPGVRFLDFPKTWQFKATLDKSEIYDCWLVKQQLFFVWKYSSDFLLTRRISTASNQLWNYSVEVVGTKL